MDSSELLEDEVASIDPAGFFEAILIYIVNVHY